VTCGGYNLHGLIERHTLHLDEIIDGVSRDVSVGPRPKVMFYDESGTVFISAIFGNYLIVVV
jgi:hypothetical protein